MLKFLWYLFLFYFAFYLIRYFFRLNKITKRKSPDVVKPQAEIKKKSEIDKDKAVDADYEEL